MRNVLTLLAAVALSFSLQNCAEPLDLHQSDLDIAVSERSGCNVINDNYLNSLKVLAATELETTPGALQIGAVLKTGPSSGEWLASNEIVSMEIDYPDEILFIGYVSSPLDDDHVAGYYYDSNYCSSPTSSKVVAGAFEDVVLSTLNTVGEDIAGF